MIWIILGVWGVVSILVTPLIGFFLFSLNKDHLPAQVPLSAAKPRFAKWGNLRLRGREYLRPGRKVMKYGRKEFRGSR